MLDRARQLRREMTLPERMLWREIRGRQLGHRFRRQVPFDPYVVDFYCPAAKLIVEVDGETHDDRQAADARRTACLEGMGYRVVRFRAVEVLVDLSGVLERLMMEIPPSGPDGPPPPRGGRGTGQGPPEP